MTNEIIKGVNNFFYFVSDMEKSIKFYRDVLGLRLVYENDNFSIFDVNGVNLGIHKIDNKMRGLDLTNLGGQVTFAVEAFSIKEIKEIIKNNRDRIMFGLKIGLNYLFKQK